MSKTCHPWLERAAQSLVASFGSGVRKNEDAVCAAIVSPWSNGRTEGQITKLKLVKRQMYGRGKIDLLQARLIGAACPDTAARVRQSPYSMPIHMNAGARPLLPDRQGFWCREKKIAREDTTHCIIDARRVFWRSFC